MLASQLNKDLQKLFSELGFDSFYSPYVLEMAREFKAKKDKILLMIARMYEDYGNVTFAEMNKYNRLNLLYNKIDAEIKELDKNINKIIAAAIIVVLAKRYNIAFYTFEKAFRTLLDYRILSDLQVGKIVDEGLRYVKWDKALSIQLQQDFSYQLKNIIMRVLKRPDLNYSELAKAISERANITAGRIEGIIRDQIGKIISHADLLAYEQAQKELKGVDLRKVWNHDLPKTNRPVHVRFSGTPADENGIFTLPNGSETEAPRLFGLPEEDINCKCFLTFRIVGDKEINIGDFSLTFNEWERLYK